MHPSSKSPTTVTHWPHAPVHQVTAGGTFFVTASTYLKMHHFRGSDRLEVLHRGLLRLLSDYGWHAEAWAVFSNHYHFVAHSPPSAGDASGLSQLLGLLHETTAKWVNRLDAAPGRKVWHNYWDTRLTYQRSYFARLNYTHQNAVKHRLVLTANAYPWCSARWFERTATPSQVKSIYSLKIDRLSVLDDYEPTAGW
ncbi:MAG TPA: hypothetical protein PLX89_22020 [Verrucomicrobiota bacterium]|nr:hypothetical protein [Verrucomicrobiales bacterium]HRI15683.1 hypothetical protein [Verrucomicrobiota bacterium]